MTATVTTVERPKRSVWVQAYVPEIVRGLSITSKQFFRNLAAGAIGKRGDVVTIQYPETKRDYPARFRGLHRLNYRDDGQVRCVACMCCSTICPANCIHIEAGEHEDPSIEKYPVSFVIDELRCIVCGLCVEACPCDAIRMDTGIHVHPFYERDTAFFDKEALLALGAPSIATQGGVNKGVRSAH
jgi:NADH-quinone oxidoreductase subunit I